MPADDLLEHAKSGADFYALLGNDIHSGSSDKDISRAYRRTALKHHPDKNRDDPNAVAKFHALQVAYDVLSDPAARAAYDAAREARERKKAQAERLDGQRRAFADELLRAEREGIKRKRDDEGGEEDAFEREIKRLAADGRRRRQERADALRREAEADQAKEEEIHRDGEKIQAHNKNSSRPAISRTVKVQFQRGQTEHSLDEGSLKAMFTSFGEVESVFMLKDKRQRPSNGQHKRIMGHAGVLFASVVGAYSAVTEWQRRSSAEWKAIDAVSWAEGKQPESTPAMAAAPDRPSTTSIEKQPLPGSANLEESTFLRLKQAQQRKAERKKYEEFLRQQEATEMSAAPVHVPSDKHEPLHGGIAEHS